MWSSIPFLKMCTNGILLNDIASLRVEPVARDTPTNSLLLLDNSRMERFTIENSVCYVTGYWLVKKNADEFNFKLSVLIIMLLCACRLRMFKCN